VVLDSLVERFFAVLTREAEFAGAGGEVERTGDAKFPGGMREAFLSLPFGKAQGGVEVEEGPTALVQSAGGGAKTGEEVLQGKVVQGVVGRDRHAEGLRDLERTDVASLEMGLVGEDVSTRVKASPEEHLVGEVVTGREAPGLQKMEGQMPGPATKVQDAGILTGDGTALKELAQERRRALGVGAPVEIVEPGEGLVRVRHGRILDGWEVDRSTLTRKYERGLPVRN